MDKVKYNIHHQAVSECPGCGSIIVEDLGEFPEADGIEIECPNCGCEYVLEGKEDL